MSSIIGTVSTEEVEVVVKTKVRVHSIRGLRDEDIRAIYDALIARERNLKLLGIHRSASKFAELVAAFELMSRDAKEQSQ